VLLKGGFFFAIAPKIFPKFHPRVLFVSDRLSRYSAFQTNFLVSKTLANQTLELSYKNYSSSAQAKVQGFSKVIFKTRFSVL